MCDFDKKKWKVDTKEETASSTNGIGQIRYLQRKECKLVDIYHPPKNQFKMVKWPQQNRKYSRSCQRESRKYMLFHWHRKDLSE